MHGFTCAHLYKRMTLQANVFTVKYFYNQPNVLTVEFFLVEFFIVEFFTVERLYS